MTRRERLAAHYIKACGICAVVIEDGKIDFTCDVGVALHESRVLLCGSRRDAMSVSFHAQYQLLTKGGDPLAWVHAVAAEAGMKLTPQARVVERAFDAVTAIERQIEVMKRRGGLKDLHRQFRQRPDRRVNYAEFIHRWKMQMLEALASIHL